jgi:hypothetical protein
MRSEDAPQSIYTRVGGIWQWAADVGVRANILLAYATSYRHRLAGLPEGRIFAPACTGGITRLKKGLHTLHEQKNISAPAAGFHIHHQFFYYG